MCSPELKMLGCLALGLRWRRLLRALVQKGGIQSDTLCWARFGRGVSNSIIGNNPIYFFPALIFAHLAFAAVLMRAIPAAEIRRLGVEPELRTEVPCLPFRRAHL
jgi:hypothetical protein